MNRTGDETPTESINLGLLHTIALYVQRGKDDAGCYVHCTEVQLGHEG